MLVIASAPRKKLLRDTGPSIKMIVRILFTFNRYSGLDREIEHYDCHELRFAYGNACT